MIDIHAHILPFLDDGAENWDVAMEMAYLAVESGTDTIVATVHSAMPGDTSHKLMNEYQCCLEEFRRRLRQEAIGLKVLPGMEVFAQGNLPQRLARGEIMGLNGTKCVLIEFHPDTPWAAINRDLERLAWNGYRPVLAHPERYRCVAEDPQCIWDWRDVGVKVQLNKGSIQGRFGSRVFRVAQEILFQGAADVVASDAHGALHRTPELRRIRQELNTMVGERYSSQLLKDNPFQLLQNG